MVTKLTTEQIISNLRQRLAETTHLCDMAFDFHRKPKPVDPKAALRLSQTIQHLENGGAYKIVGQLLITVKYGPIAI